MKKRLSIILLIFLSFSNSLLFSQSGNLEESVDESLVEMTQLGEELDPQKAESKEVDGVLPKDASLLDRMIFKIKAKFEKEIKSNPFKRISGPEVESMVLERTAGTFIGNYLKESPRLLYFIVNFLRDEFAMHDMAQIFKKEKELKTYSYFVIGNIIFFFFLGLYYDRKSRSGFIGAIFRKIFIFVLSSAISLAVFYVLFHKELKPTIGIAQEAIVKAI